MRENILLKATGIVAAISGVIILLGTIYPIATYERESRLKYPKLLSPVTGESSVLSQVAPDYTKASNWFVGGVDKENFVTSKISHYTISINKLGIENATVTVGGEDLAQSLIQYPGTGLPGKVGNAVVFGHSILPQFFNPKEYISIFSTLPSLEKGDIIKVAFDGVTYTYKVETTFEVLPTQLSVLDQPIDDSYLSLITCVPPGHPLKPKRLVVRAKVIPPDISIAK